MDVLHILLWGGWKIFLQLLSVAFDNLALLAGDRSVQKGNCKARCFSFLESDFRNKMAHESLLWVSKGVSGLGRTSNFRGARPNDAPVGDALKWCIPHAGSRSWSILYWIHPFYLKRSKYTSLIFVAIWYLVRNVHGTYRKIISTLNPPSANLERWCPCNMFMTCCPRFNMHPITRREIIYFPVTVSEKSTPCARLPLMDSM